jgi:adenylate cyclase class 2
MSSAMEREIKLRFDSPDAARRAVAALGGSLLKARRLQSDALFDTTDNALMLRQAVLRIRRDGDTSYVTFKNPVVHPTMKLREEFETAIGDAAVVSAIFDQLGFQIWFRYEKYREEFRVDDVVIAIDETPVGTFVEIEGSEHGITAVAHRLGREPSDYVVESYRSLFVNYCAARGLEPTHMIFGV